jgi:hypothetical protein
MPKLLSLGVRYQVIYVSFCKNIGTSQMFSSVDALLMLKRKDHSYYQEHLRAGQTILVPAAFSLISDSRDAQPPSRPVSSLSQVILFSDRPPCVI